jgi:hypothetical protein
LTDPMSRVYGETVTITPKMARAYGFTAPEGSYDRLYRGDL